MPASKGPSSRVFVRFPLDRLNSFQGWATELGMTMSDLIALCAWVGSHTVIPSLIPSDYQKLKILADREQEEMYQEMAEDYFEAQEQTQQMKEFWMYREEFLQWRQQKEAAKEAAS